MIFKNLRIKLAHLLAPELKRNFNMLSATLKAREAAYIMQAWNLEKRETQLSPKAQMLELVNIHYKARKQLVNEASKTFADFNTQES